MSSFFVTGPTGSGMTRGVIHPTVALSITGLNNDQATNAMVTGPAGRGMCYIDPKGSWPDPFDESRRCFDCE